MISKYKLRSCFVRFVAIKPAVSIEAAPNALPLQPPDDLDVTINSSKSDKSMQSLRSMDTSEESRTSKTSLMEISFSESSPSFNQPNRANELVPSVPWLPLLRDDPFQLFHPFLTIQRFLSISFNTIQRFVISTLSNKSQ